MLKFTNRLGHSYYIKSKLTKKGNTTYYMTKKKDATCLDSLPEGYEVFEKPDTCMIYIRKVPKKDFSEEEILIIKRALKNNKAVTGFKLDIVANLMKVYTAEESAMFEERMRFIKYKNDMGYEVQRYCYRGRIDDWISIDGGDDLQDLANTNIPHLGKMSYYDLV